MKGILKAAQIQYIAGKNKPDKRSVSGDTVYHQSQAAQLRRLLSLDVKVTA
ncbi:hypothetical protein [Escherichia albertii]|uniref:hypothetical protein n=1 Tax=Escherichia albertii TaxID=208962 RepID=UPI0012FDE580|nr:hypothetical protein [Escherichia albertii]MCQ8964166.1 hypothetical protein [Escherichia albertii]MCZ8629977.1 hypothetical protein [Escherichia albertii]MCZ8636229.1 hypothetical protein [Escherichia albertii]MCZ8670446.1 hypothetical protein [Escherichia albertii]MCZ8806504.1 hypothetical protein [Escherichia albertii]